MQTFGVNKVSCGRCAIGEFSEFKGVQGAQGKARTLAIICYYFEMRKSFIFFEGTFVKKGRQLSFIFCKLTP